MSFIAGLKSSWHQGRGDRASRKHNYNLALNYYITSLEYARKTKDNHEIIVPLGCVGETYFHLKQYDNAKQYLTEYQELFAQLPQITQSNPLLKEHIERLNSILETIKQIEEQDKQ